MFGKIVEVNNYPQPFLKLTKIDKWKAIVLLFFVCYFLLGSFLFRDYGVSIDETAQVNKARITLNYVFGRSDELLTYADRHYGAIFPSLLLLGNNFFSDSRDVMLYRHYVTFLVFFLSVIAFYKLLRKLGYQRQFALLGTLFLIIQPHIFAQSFYNPKDVPFLAMFILAMYTLANFLKKQDLPSILLHSLVSGLLVVFRLPGILMLGFTGILIVWLYLVRRASMWRMLWMGMLYVGLALLSLYIFMPALWAHPLSEFKTFVSAELFTWSSVELYFGKYYALGQIPFGHVFVYFAVVMPPVILALFAMGLGVIGWKLTVERGLFDGASWPQMMALVQVLVTAEIFLVQRPGVYNGWRHVLFFYPILLLVVMEALRWVWQAGLEGKIKKLWVGLVGASVAAQVALLVVFILQSHPHEFTYYSVLAGQNLSQARANFIMDYWGLSFREALEKILASDDRTQIKIAANAIFPVEQNILILPKEQRDRIVVIPDGSPEKPDYFLDNYYTDLSLERPGYKLIDQIRVRDAVINGSYIPQP